MHLWTLLSVVLTVALLALAQEYDNNDSLMAALDAVNRRQRDLANSDANANYYGLSPYRENGEEVVYLNPVRDPNEDGQPENIGYGFQKSLGNIVPSAGFDSPPDMEALTAAANDKLLEKLAIDYLENEFQNDNDANQYYRVGDEAKRSAFRERQFPDRFAAKIADGVKKRSDFGGPTSFRERSQNGEDVMETRRQLMKTISRRMEQERELEEAEGEGYPIMPSHFEHSRISHPNGLDLESLTENEVEEILDYLGEGGPDGKDDDSRLDKRYNGGTGYNFFNHGAAMNAGGFGFKKRSKQRLDETEGPDNAFLYSLKYVSPEYNREAVEQLRENDGIDFSGENDEDVLRLGMKAASEAEHRDRERERWMAATQDDEEESPNSLPHEGHSKKSYHVPQELVVPLHHIQKKYPYDPILFKKKRIMMAKRSSEFYTSPPALHHHVGGEIRRKKDASDHHSTDPQVASELSHIFSPASQENQIKIVPQIIGNHVVTKQKVTTTTSPPVTQKQNTTNIEVTVVVNQYVKKNDTPSEDEANDDEIELPVTMSRLEIPIEVRKKSIDWSDYFGLDRRRKKTGSNLQDSRSRMMDEDSPLFNQYYKSGGAKKSSAFRSNKNGGAVLYKKSIHVLAQPFDTRIFDAERSQQFAKKSRGVDIDETRVDNMNSKLRNIEDLIVNEAVKYTGAHEGTTDSKEIQDVKDKVMSRLAAAYNLEKMRRALGEFKSSLAAQKMSKYNPENRAGKEDAEESVKKRVAFKKDKSDGESEKMELKNDSEKKGYAGEMQEGHEGYGDAMIDTMSEGYMGGARPQPYDQNEEECPILSNIVQHCHGIQSRAGDEQMQFLPLCTLHQICYVCGADASCDGLFLSRANDMCNGDMHCEKRALRTVMAASRHRVDEFPGVDGQCWERFCDAPLPPNQPPWNHS